jgi:hypothetical protein
MQLTFNSRSLGRGFVLDELPSLTKTQLRVLHGELISAIEAMDAKIQEVKAQEALGVEVEDNWLHRVNKKRAICQTFADQAAELLFDAGGSFEQVYRLKLEELLLEELGEQTWLEIKGEAMEFALANRPQVTPAA